MYQFRQVILGSFTLNSPFEVRSMVNGIVSSTEFRTVNRALATSAVIGDLSFEGRGATGRLSYRFAVARPLHDHKAGIHPRRRLLPRR